MDANFELSDPVDCCPLCGGAIAPYGQKSRGQRTYHYDRCRRCTFVFVNPRPSAADLRAYYAQAGPPQIPPPRTNTKRPRPDAYARMITARLRRQNPAGKTLLDVGAGDGEFIIPARDAGLACTAIELDPTDVANLRALGGTRVLQTSFEALRAADQTFDFLIMSHVLEHAHDPMDWIARAARLLNPGGVVSIMLPHVNSIYRLRGRMRDPYFYPPEHLNHFNIRSLRRLCRSQGLPPIFHTTTTVWRDDVLTKRFPIPAPLRPLVRAITRAASTAAHLSTMATDTGASLILLAKKIT